MDAEAEPLPDEEPVLAGVAPLAPAEAAEVCSGGIV